MKSFLFSVAFSSFFALPGYSQPPTTYAVVVGIADYQILTYRTGDLRYADRDAQRFAAFLMSQAGGSTPTRNIRLLTNRQATKRPILEAMTLFRQARPQDRVIFYFSGHGLVGAFVPHDAQANQPGTLLAHRDVKRLFKASAAKTKLCIADACMSGSLKPGRVASTLGVNEVQPGVNVATLLSSRAGQSSAESVRLNSGVFTHYLLAGLKGAADANQDGVITIRETYRYVSPRVRRSASHEQAPVFTGNFSNELVLAVVER